MPSGYIHTINKQNGNIVAGYMQEERRGSTFERTPNKREQNDLMNSGVLNRFMACQPRTYSQFLYTSSLAAHMLTVFKTSTVNIKTTNNNGHMQL